MKKLVNAFAVATFALFAVGCSGDNTETADSNNEQASDTTAADETKDEHDHTALVEVSDDLPVPTVEAELADDAVEGHNLFVELGDFEISPENASTDAVDGQGHMHLYINGERKLRFYNTHIHLTGLNKGDQVEVELSANNHSAYAVDGEAIRAAVTVASDVNAAIGEEPEKLKVSTAPDLSVAVTPDPKSGYNLEVDSEEFDISGNNVNDENADNEGYAQVIVDRGSDVEQNFRIYGNWTHIKLEPGTHEVEVELRSNNHEVIEGPNGVVTAAQTVMVEASEDGDSSKEGHHDSGEDHSGTGSTVAIGDQTPDTAINLTVTDGKVEIDDTRYDLDEGDLVTVTVTSDIDESIHVHGVDILVPLKAGEETEFAFEASKVGKFEVELEEAQTFLFDLVVR